MILYLVSQLSSKWENKGSYSCNDLLVGFVVVPVGLVGAVIEETHTEPGMRVDVYYIV